jgi:hypothetical protein
MSANEKNKIEPKDKKTLIDEIAEKDNELNKSSKVTNIELIKTVKCNFCNRCDVCECELNKEKKNKIEQGEFKINLSALNYLAFMIFFAFVFGCNTTIWLMITN